MPVRAGLNQATGENFFGARIDDTGPGGVVSRTAQLATDLFSPIGPGQAAQEIARERIPGAAEIVPGVEARLGTGGLLAQATGINLRAETTPDLIVRTANELGFSKPLVEGGNRPIRDTRDLSPSQRDQVEAEIGQELRRRQATAETRGSEFAEAQRVTAEITDARMKAEQALADELVAGTLPGESRRDQMRAFTEAYGDIQLRAVGERAGANRAFALFQETRELPEDPFDRALVQHYAAYDLARSESGILDFDRLERRHGLLKRRWTPAQRIYVIRNTGLAEHPPLVQEFLAARRAISQSGYWDLPAGSDRTHFRERHPDVDVALVKWYGYEPRSPAGERAKAETRELEPAGV